MFRLHRSRSPRRVTTDGSARTTGRIGPALSTATAMAAAAVLLGAGLVAAPSAAAAATTFQVPFPCGQTWTGGTRTDHNPLNAMDFNRPDDVNDPVVASAKGTVVTAKDVGNRSYGRYVVVDHGGGWSTLYAHLASSSVKIGQKVAMGARLGTVGARGTISPHLHYEQRLNGTSKRITFDGAGTYYYGKKAYTSKNSCRSGFPGTVRTAGSPLTVRSGPGTGHTAVGSVANSARITILCQTTGTSVTGTYGTTKLWDRIGTGRYVSDAYVYTGSDGRVAPVC